MTKKRLFFFDIDHTLYCNEQKEIPSQTKKLLQQLSKNPNNVLGIATGRSYSGVSVLKGLMPLFQYFVVLNGAMTFKNDQIIQTTPILKEDVLKLNQKAYDQQISVVNVEFKKTDILGQKDPDSQPFINNETRQNQEEKKKSFHLSNFEKPIYKINLFHVNTAVIVDLLKDFPQLHAYFWNNGVVSLSAKQVNKAYGIKPVQKNYPNYQLICVGDGCNDVEMFQSSNLAIVMNNTKYPDLKKIAHLVAPHIEENKLYDFFNTHNLI
ncbi:HAD-IIB family hydrolase [Candidatus Phytoplasma meliae]|uniref:HAD-IIB family hydrolase n=1 Tax=Candidatus Phytoplasma meliae TaxID=1848402 RepID=A0ABS5CXL2_9MOLU|nr:HAD family hydrolase [Candidatus Phytoplasma meliae]MBP5835717.1 HAD-IIB family hydrolase [Candidatus Phytoplasma meliae]